MRARLLEENMEVPIVKRSPRASRFKYRASESLRTMGFNPRVQWRASR